MAETVSIPKLLGTAVYLLAWPTLLFVLAGDWRWVEGWIFSAWFVALCTICIVWLYRKDPALLAERYRRPGSGGQKGWDRFVVYAIVLGFVSWIVVMPLDVKRFTDNTFLSPLVRIQSERKQRVVTTGVYSFVRHPMYLGAVLMFEGAPLLLGSTCGLLLAGAMSVLLAARIVGEEKMLTTELEGYEEYCRRVRYRLLPFIW